MTTYLFLFYGLPELDSGGYVMRVPFTTVQGVSEWACRDFSPKICST